MLEKTNVDMTNFQQFLKSISKTGLGLIYLMLKFLDEGFLERALGQKDQSDFI